MFGLRQVPLAEMNNVEVSPTDALSSNHCCQKHKCYNQSTGADKPAKGRLPC